MFLFPVAFLRLWQSSVLAMCLGFSRTDAPTMSLVVQGSGFKGVVWFYNVLVI